MENMKALGPDGFERVFYQSYLDTLCADVHGTTVDFLNGVLSSHTLNLTHIVLLSSILKPHLIKIISHSQNAFIPERQIHYNIIRVH